MARSWGKVRQELADSGLLDEQRVAAARAEQEDAMRAYRLAEVRKSQGETQTSLAQQMHVSQARISRIEKGDLAHTELGTLESYIEALGGKLRIVAEFGQSTVTVH